MLKAPTLLAIITISIPPSSAVFSESFQRELETFAAKFTLGGLQAQIILAFMKFQVLHLRLELGTSLVVQGLRIHLAVQGTWV